VLPLRVLDHPLEGIEVGVLSNSGSRAVARFMAW
jgi:hypothetical protein